jgi:PAS domain S-box-containing protein
MTLTDNTSGLADEFAVYRFLLSAPLVPVTISEWATGNILHVNDMAAALFGLPADAIVGRSMGEFYGDPSGRERFLRAIAENDGVTRMDLELRRADGGFIWVQAAGGRVRYRGIDSIIAVINDITVQKLREAELADAGRKLTEQATDLTRLTAELRVKKHAAEAANAAKSSFLAHMSHELRSPLNAILGWNRILAVKRGDDPEVAAVTPRIERSAKAQLKLVNDLLDLGRLGTGKLRITPRTMKLTAVTGAAVDAIRPAATTKQLDVRTQFSSANTEVHGDPDRLQQVISNLLSNAMKFTPAGGRIDVKVGAVEDVVELCVTDTGQGIAPELLPHVFDRFRQGEDASVTRRAGGLGLGLTLVREIVALHGGTVSASSEGPGKGAAFRVRLPSAQFANAAAADPEADGEARTNGSNGASRALEGLSILVVDDEADARTVVAETLRLEGARVTVSDSAGSALDQLCAPGARYDVIVTDIGMPEEDGYSLVRKLRALNNGDRMVAIAVTGFASRTDVEAAIDAGFDLHVPKPVDFESFVPIIRRLSAAR